MQIMFCHLVQLELFPAPGRQESVLVEALQQDRVVAAVKVCVVRTPGKVALSVPVSRVVKFPCIVVFLNMSASQ